MIAKNVRRRFFPRRQRVSGKSLKHPVVAHADREQVRHVLRSDHRAVRGSGGPVVFIRTAIRALRDALPAQPKHVCKQKEEQQKRVFFRDAIEPDRRSDRRPTTPRQSVRLRRQTVRRRSGRSESYSARRRLRRAIAERFQARSDERVEPRRTNVVPFFGEDDRGGLKRLHQHRVFAVRAG